MYIFTCIVESEVSPYDIFDVNKEYIKFELLDYNEGTRKYLVKATKLTFLIEALVAVNFGNQLEVVGMLHTIEAKKGSLYDKPTEM